MGFIIQNAPPYSFINSLLNKIRTAGELNISKSHVVEKKENENKKFEKTVVSSNTKVVGGETDMIGTDIDGDKHVALLKEYAYGLEAMMFITHHKVRQPVANILTLSDMITGHENSPEELKKIVHYIKQSASDLDTFTRELTTLISKLEKKGKYKK